MKVSTAMKVVAGAAATSAIVGAVPIPMADAPIILAIQAGMLMTVTAIFGLNPKNLNMKALIGGVGGPFAAATAGKAVVS